VAGYFQHAKLRAQAAGVQQPWDQYPDNACMLYQVAAMYAQADRAGQALATLRDMAS
jgi:hypothetical protein